MNLFLAWLFVFNVAEHPIYISVSDVTISETEIEWSVRIFKDDLLLAVYGDGLDMSVLDKEDKVKKDILAYLSRTIRISADNVNVSWTLRDLHPDPEAIWITIASPVKAHDIKKLKIRNTILLEVYRDQKNIVNLTSLSLKRNMVFDKGGDEKTIEF